MIEIILTDAEPDADMESIARAFAITRAELEQGISAGTISRWFEVGEDDNDSQPQMILQSGALGLRVVVDHAGNVISATSVQRHEPLESPFLTASEQTTAGTVAPERSDATATVDTAQRARLEALLDEALGGSFPASDPVAISFDAPRLSMKRGPTKPPIPSSKTGE